MLGVLSAHTSEPPSLSEIQTVCVHSKGLGSVSGCRIRIAGTKGSMAGTNEGYFWYYLNWHPINIYQLDPLRGVNSI